ncbi:MAG TPA: class I SAM-dependent methyltransferase [Actinomycetota bacterium]|nr:class I SAM-dependent methyltransferase [Actinomycetota bacterium]
MPWFFAVVESKHELQNPTSPEKILLLGERLGLLPNSRVLDMASGRGGPAILLAGEFGCRITCVERAEEFDVEARRRAREAGVDSLIEFVHADAREFRPGSEGYDVALCLGASFIWDGLPGTLATLTPAVRPSGFVAVGEPYWRTWPLPESVDPDWREDFVTLPETVERFEAAGVRPVTIIDSSLDDWDRYETLHWLAADEWLTEHPDDPDREEIRTRVEGDRDEYLRWQRKLLGWSIIVGRKR